MFRTVAWMLLSLAACVGQAGSFTREEVERILAYWRAPGRYEASVPPSAVLKGEWQVRLTPAGSKWLWDYGRARGLVKGPPSQISVPQGNSKTWEAWIDARVAHDRWIAEKDAAEKKARSFTIKEAPDPGPAPDSLLELMTEPPPFAEAVRPMQHSIRFDNDAPISFVDNPNMRPRYAYYRSPGGVMSIGTPVKNLPESDLDRLFDKADVEPSARRVMKAVSLLEGGFDAVNTYDTGFVSVGFIQFACLKEGAGSLGAVLQSEKSASPDDFEKDFRAFGIDVLADNRLVALDLESGEEKRGADAAAQIIGDKRLAAVFAHAGRESDAFRIAQIRVAESLYYPASDPISISAGGQTISGKISDVVTSEAGIATLMDRKVNTGKLQPLTDVLSQIAREYGLAKLSDLAQFERDIIMALRHRVDYLADASLVQPGPQARPERIDLPSRHKPRAKGGGW